MASETVPLAPATGGRAPAWAATSFSHSSLNHSVTVGLSDGGDGVQPREQVVTGRIGPGQVTCDFVLVVGVQVVCDLGGKPEPVAGGGVHLRRMREQRFPHHPVVAAYVHHDFG